MILDILVQIVAWAAMLLPFIYAYWHVSRTQKTDRSRDPDQSVPQIPIVDPSHTNHF